MHQPEFFNVSNRTEIPMEDDDDEQRDSGVSCFWAPCFQCCIIGMLVLGTVLAVILALFLKPTTRGNSSIMLSTSGWLSITASYTSTTSTSTTTSSTTSTSDTSTTSTTTVTTATTTSTPFDSCRFLQWNQTGTVYAGDGGTGLAANQLENPHFIYIDNNDSLFICDHHNYRIQQYLRGSSSGITILTLNTQEDHPESITFDKNGYMYITGHQYERVIRVNPDFSNFTTVAGQPGVSGSTTFLLDEPMGLAVDDDLNLYVAERQNRRVTKWAPNATSGTVVIDGAFISSQFYGLLRSWHSPNQVYVSSEMDDKVYLWTFGLPTPSKVLTAVNDTTNTLDSPRGMKNDIYGNLYVADRGNRRIVMYCNNSTVGTVVIGGTKTTPNFYTISDVALDSDLNIYVSDTMLSQVIKFDRII